ncbi:MAG: hypothetical protein FWE03_07450 [Firmicutes bacterium]|nr:hypothetical protein [Bacillota bacterium]
MDNSRINQSQLNYNCGAGEASVNLRTGRMLFDHPIMSVGSNSFQMGVSLVYNSQGIGMPTGFDTGLGNWKLNIQQYVFPYTTNLNYPEFQANDYVYVDGSGYKYRFVWYKQMTEHGRVKQFYYDAGGSGLKFTTDGATNAQGIPANREVIDETGTVLKFRQDNGALFEIMSGVNSQIVKDIVYTDGRLTAISDRRRPTRRIDFTYTNDRLNEIKCTESNRAIRLMYSSTGLITRTRKHAGQDSKNLAHFYYNENNRLSFAADSEDASALGFSYDSSNRIVRVNTGIVNHRYGTIRLGDEVVGDHVRVGMVGMFLRGEMPDDNIRTYSTFAYATTRTNVRNEKGINLAYFFNNRGFTTGILEDIGTEDYRTLAKTSGWQLWDAGSGAVFLNNSRVLSITTPHNNNCLYDIPAARLTAFRNVLINSANTNRRHEFSDYFTVSFWARFANSTNNVRARFSYDSNGFYRGGGGSIATGNFTNNYHTILDNAANSWQYITIPVRFDECQGTWVRPQDMNSALITDIKTNMTNLRLTFEGYNGTVDIADLRIAPSNYLRTFVRGADFDIAERVLYTNAEGTNRNRIINSDFFITETDLFKTHRNMFYASEQNAAVFDLVHNDGTRVESIQRNQNTPAQALRFRQRGSTTDHVFSVDTQRVPQYYTQSRNRTASSNWCVTENQARFQYCQGMELYYFEQRTTVGMTGFNGRPTVPSASESYIWVNDDGTHRATKDAYNIITENFYDTFGNLTSVEVFNENQPTAQRLRTIFGYGTVSANLRENPTSITENGIVKNLSFTEMTQRLRTAQAQGGNPIAHTSQFDYNQYEDRLNESSARGASNNRLANNTLTYDFAGRLGGVTDQAGRQFEFEYNKFGEATAYKQNGDLILEKEIERSENNDTIIEKRYRTSSTTNPDTTTIIVDAHGRVNSQINASQNISYTYQDERNPYAANDPRHALFSFTESKFAAEVTQIQDPYENRTYNFHYDEENRPCGYHSASSALGQVGQRWFEVRQTTVGETEHRFFAHNQTHMSVVEYDDTFHSNANNREFIEPRIRRTREHTGAGTPHTGRPNMSTQEDFTKVYNYDHLGRLRETLGEFINTTGNWHVRPSVVRTYNSNSLINSYVIDTFLQRMGAGSSGPTPTHYTITQRYEYDARGNLNSFTESGDAFVFGTGRVALHQKNIAYNYDGFNRLTSENNNSHANFGNFVYTYNAAAGNLTSITRNGGAFKSFSYANGRRTRINSTTDNIHYDNYGNITRIRTNNHTWDSRNLLSGRGGVNYAYNHQDIMTRRTANGMNTEFYLDGNKILGEDLIGFGPNCGTPAIVRSFRYVYDAEGICGIRHNSNNYRLVRDAMGNVSKVFRLDRLLAEYVYDAWGNVQVIKHGNLSGEEHSVIDNNPFRWKGYYYDIVTQCYYINGRWYDPEIMQYLSADSPENLFFNAGVVNALDRNAVSVDNVVGLLPNLDNVFPSGELHPDSNFDPNAGRSWWSLNWRRAVRWIVAATIFLAGIILSIIPGTQAFGLGMLKAGLKMAVSGAVIGGVLGGAISAANGDCFWEGLAQGAIVGAMNGFIAGSLLFFGKAAIKGIVGAVKPKPPPSVGSGSPIDAQGALRPADPMANSEAMQIFNNFDANNAFVKTHHLATTKGGGAKFIGSKAEAEAVLREVIRGKKIVSIVDNGLTAKGHKSYQFVLNAGKPVGVKEQTHIRVVIASDGGMLSAFPVWF